jgi:hypothetical protein
VQIIIRYWQQVYVNFRLNVSHPVTTDIKTNFTSLLDKLHPSHGISAYLYTGTD